MTLLQYIELQRIERLSGLQNTDREILKLSVLSGKKPGDLRQISKDDFKRFYDAMESDLKTDIEPIQTVGEYSMPKNMGSYPLVHWIGLESYVLNDSELLTAIQAGNFESVPFILAVASVPSDVSLAKYRKDASFDGWTAMESIRKREDFFRGVDVNQGLGMLAFFLKRWTAYNKRTNASLRRRERLKKILTVLRRNITGLMGGKASSQT